MKRTDFQDARVDKPRCINPVLVCTSDGHNYVAQWDGHKWWDSNTREQIDGVEYFYDYFLPAGWKITDDYYEDFKEDDTPMGYCSTIARIMGDSE